MQDKMKMISFQSVKKGEIHQRVSGADPGFGIRGDVSRRGV